jgi:hypothetical protein
VRQWLLGSRVSAVALVCTESTLQPAGLPPPSFSAVVCEMAPKVSTCVGQ